MDILSVFCHIDDFCCRFEPAWRQHLLASTGKKRNRTSRFSLSEIMTILVLFHDPHYRTFKHFYLRQVREHWRAEFPALPSYSRFVELIPTALIPLLAYLQTRRGTCTGLQFIDSLPIRVAITAGFTRTRSLRDWHNAAKAAWVGSTASSCIWSLTSKAKC